MAELMVYLETPYEEATTNEDESYHNVIAEMGKAEYTSTQHDHSRDGLSLCSP